MHSPEDNNPTRSFAPNQIESSNAETRTYEEKPSRIISLPMIPGYEVFGELARGGMGVVYRARQLGTGRAVAIKVIAPGREASPQIVARFRAEVDAVAALDHTGIVPVYEAGEIEGMPFFSMKLIEGQSLKDALSREDWQLTISDRVRLLTGVARAVGHAHQRGIIHRDLKPGNILLDTDGVPHVADFGLAKRITGENELTSTGAIMGTPLYMSPEQVIEGAKAATTMSDVYALGTIFYELLTRKRPYTGDTPLALAKQIAEVSPDPPSHHAPNVPRDLEAICLKCLSKDPRQRYQTAIELANDLENWSLGMPTAARPPSLARLMWSWFAANLRTAMRVFLIAFVCSFLGTMGLMYAAMLSVLRNAANSYDKFPSVSRPWILRVNWELVADFMSGGPGLILLLFALIAAGGMGLFVSAAINTRDRWADLTAGLGSGLVAGFTFMFFGGMQSAIIALIIVPQIESYMLLSDGCFISQWPPPDRIDYSTGLPPVHPSQQFIEKHPELKNYPEDEQSGLIMAQLVSYQVAQAFQCVWIGGVMALFFGGIIGVFQTIVAGHLRRTARSWWRVLLFYILITGLCYPIVIGLFGMLTRWSMLVADEGLVEALKHSVAMMVISIVCITAAAGVMVGWKFVRKLAILTTFLATGLLILDTFNIVSCRRLFGIDRSALITLALTSGAIVLAFMRLQNSKKVE